MAPPAAAFPGWPEEVDGRPLTARALAARERRLPAGFPGRIAAFGDGRRLLVLRWVTRPTRQLHAAADCFRGAGYAVSPRPLRRDAAGRVWAVTAGRRGDARLRIAERIVGSRGDSFTDVSSWYWAALLGRSEGPWWAWTVVAKDPSPPG